MNRAKDQASDGKLNANDVGRQFLAQYYNAMAENIDAVARSLYSDASIVKRFGNAPVSGLENIRAELSQHHKNNKFKVRIWNTICLNSLENSINMQVAGEYIQEEGEARAFLQNVVLASQGPRKYYIHSDMVEWLDDLYPNAEIKKLETAKQPQFNGHTPTNTREPPAEPATYKKPDAHRPPPPQHHSQQAAEGQTIVQNGQPNAHHPQHQQQHPQAAPVQQPPAKEHSLTPSDVADKFAQLNAQKEPPFSHVDGNLKTREPPAPQQQNAKPTESAAPPPPQQQQQQQQETGPRTWAKLVSGEMKSNGLPPPTQPPADASAQGTNTGGGGQGKFHNKEGGQGYGNKEGNYQRDRGNDFNKDGSRSYRQRRPNDRPSQYRRDYDGPSQQQGGAGNGNGGGGGPKNTFNGGGGGGERSYYRKPNNPAGNGGNSTGGPPQRREQPGGPRGGPRQQRVGGPQAGNEQ